MPGFGVRVGCGAGGPDLFGAALDDDLGVTPFRITNDAHPDEAPALAADGNKILAVYSSFRAAYHKFNTDNPR